jgi:hypothetical protein
MKCMFVCHITGAPVRSVPQHGAKSSFSHFGGGVSFGAGRGSFGGGDGMGGMEGMGGGEGCHGKRALEHSLEELEEQEQAESQGAGGGGGAFWSKRVCA